MSLSKKWAIPDLFFILFGSIPTNNEILQQIHAKTDPYSIHCQELNPQPLDRQSLPTTTRPVANLMNTLTTIVIYDSCQYNSRVISYERSALYKIDQLTTQRHIENNKNLTFVIPNVKAQKAYNVHGFRLKNFSKPITPYHKILLCYNKITTEKCSWASDYLEGLEFSPTEIGQNCNSQEHRTHEKHNFSFRHR